MSIASSVPLGLLLPAAALVTLAYASGTDGPPDPAPSASYTWTTLHRPRGEVSDAIRLGTMITDVVQHGNTVIATAVEASLRSVDGGTTWNEMPGLRHAFDVAFANNGVVVAGRAWEGVALSVNDGETWTDVKTDADGGMLSVVFAGDTGFATSNGSLLRSVDGGQTWQRRATERVLWNDLAFAGRTAIAVGGAGLVARTADGGETWQSHWLRDERALNGVAFAGDRTVVIVGIDGAILRSTDAGLSWSTVTSPTRAHLRAVAFASPTEGLAVGFWGEAIRTSDGGASWTRERTGTRMHLLAVTARPGGGFLVSGTAETVLAVAPGGAR